MSTMILYELLFWDHYKISCILLYSSLRRIFLFREVYHTKRMQRVVCVRWSLDDKYILSGSDEMNIRVWKAHASEKIGVVSDTKYNYEQISTSLLFVLEHKGEAIPTQHFCHHRDTICHPKSSYITTTLKEMSACGCNSNTFIQQS